MNFNQQQLCGMVPNVQNNLPKTTSWLTDEQDNLLKSNAGQFTLSVTDVEMAVAICNHYDRATGKSLLIEDGDNSGGVTCQRCQTHFYLRKFSKDVKNTIQNFKDIANTIKVLYRSLSPATGAEFFQMLALVEKVLPMAEIAFADFGRYLNATDNLYTINSGLNPVGLMSALMNPIMFQQQPVYAAPQQQYVGQPVQVPYNPMFSQQVPMQQVQQQPYQPAGNGFAYAPQGAAAPPVVNTNMPTQPQQQVPADANNPAVTSNFSK